MMSTGLAPDQLAGSPGSNAAFMVSVRGANGTPSRAQASAASTPAPPPLVTSISDEAQGLCVATSLTIWPLKCDRVSAASKRSCSVSTRSMPARRMAASKTMSEAAKAPVCEAAAAWPWAERPALTISTGLLRAAARAADMNLRAPSTDSAYSRMARVCGQPASQSSRSPKSTSACSPSEMQWEKPMPRAAAQSSIAVTSAPDCETKARLPGWASRWAKLAFRPAYGDSRPRQLGPRMRSRCRPAAASIAALVAASSPAVSTTAARVPRAPSASISPGTLAGGVQITARSGGAGKPATSG